MRRVCTRTVDGAAQAGGAPIGIGIRGLTPSLSFRAMGFSTAHLAGASIHRGGSTRLRSSDMDMDTADMVGTAGMVDTSTITSVKTLVTGGRALTMQQDAVTPTASITEQDLQEGVSIPAPRWLAAGAASEDSAAVELVVAASMAVDFTGAAVFMEAVAVEAIGEITIKHLCHNSCKQSRWGDSQRGR